MATVTAFEAKTRFGELLDRVSKGEEVVITRHDKAVARLIPGGAQRLDEAAGACRACATCSSGAAIEHGRP
jgi:prevent-host-death family protein